MIITELSARGAEIDCQPRYRDFRLGDVRHSQADISKAERLIGWRPQWTTESALAETASALTSQQPLVAE